jgi:beta-lactamase regulating signal transducer with metallopeptidase domain
MIASIMIYALLISVLVGVGAMAVERGFAVLAWSRRGVWLVAMVTSLGLPALMMISAPTTVAPEIAPQLAVRLPAMLTLQSPMSAQTTPGSVTARLKALMEIQWPVFPKFDVALRCLWLALSLCVLTFYLIGWTRLHRQAGDWPTEELLGEVVRVSDHVGPAVLGFVDPQIIVPRWLLAATPTIREMAIKHELEHIAARDPLCLFVALLLVAIAPWNPVLWWQFRRLRFFIEVDCDARVLRRDTDVSTYGEALLSIGQHDSRTPVGAVALTETASRLERRIRIMTTETHRHAKRVIFTAVATFASCIAVAAQLSAPAKIVTLASANSEAHAEFKGDRLNLRLKEADLRDVISMLAHNATQNVYISSKVGGKISIQFNDTPSGEALDIILRSKDLVKRQEGNTIFIDPAAAPVSETRATPSPQYSGERINLHFEDIEIRNVFRVLADVAHQNIVASDDVQGKISVDLKDTPWDEALDIVLHMSGLVSRQEGKIYFIGVAPTTAIAVEVK